MLEKPGVMLTASAEMSKSVMTCSAVIDAFVTVIDEPDPPKVADPPKSQRKARNFLGRFSARTKGEAVDAEKTDIKKSNSTLSTSRDASHFIVNANAPINKLALIGRKIWGTRPDGVSASNFASLAVASGSPLTLARALTIMVAA